MVAKPILANYLTKVWGLVSVFLFVPLYIQLLGLEGYGLIGFYSALTVILFFADAGMSATLNRELARTPEKEGQLQLVITLEKVMLLVAATIALVIAVFSKTLVASFVHVQQMSIEQAQWAVGLMGLAVAGQLASVLYTSGIIGLHHHVAASVLNVGWSCIRMGLVLAPLYFFPHVLVFFGWQCVVNLSYAWLCRQVLIQKIDGSSKRVGFDAGLLRQLQRFALGAMAISMIGGAATQFDKFYVSHLLPMTQYSHYALASTLGQLPVLMVAPISVALLPTLVRMTQADSSPELIKRFFLSYSFLNGTVAAVLSVLLVGSGEFLIVLWTGNPVLAHQTAPLLSTLALAYGFLSNVASVNQLALAFGYNRIAIYWGLISLCLMAVASPVAASRYGPMGVAWTLVAVHALGLLVQGWFQMRRLPGFSFRNWFFIGSIVPTVVGVGSMMASVSIASQLEDSKLRAWCQLITYLVLCTNLCGVLYCKYFRYLK